MQIDRAKRDDELNNFKTALEQKEGEYFEMSMELEE